jgi:sarcosine oxidase subunit beta
MKNTAEVVVVGAGVIGCSIAYYLAKIGVKVTVIEKRPGLCYGASGSNQAGCNFYFDSPAINQLARESSKLHIGLSEEIKYNTEFHIERRITCSTNEEHHPYLENRAKELIKNGLTARLMKGDELRKQEPALGERVIIGLEQESGTVNPFRLNYGLGRAAEKLGTKFLFSSEVKGIGTEKGKIVSVTTDKEKISTYYLVNATGAWASDIGKMVGMNIPIKPRRGQVIVTEPIPLNKTWRRIVDAHFLTTTFSSKTDEQQQNPWFRLGIAGAFCQDMTGNWTIGSSHDYPGYNATVTIDTVKFIAKRAIEFMPKLKDVNCIRMFAGLRSFCYADGIPIIDKTNDPSGLFIASGHAGYGIALAPITGKIISELISENKTSVPIEAFSMSRFK